MHVHVHHAEGEAKFWLEPRIELAENYGMSRQRLARARRLVEENEMRSGTHGKVTSPVEVTNVSQHGFWLFLDDRERFISFREFPWFRDASIAALCNVKRPQPHHLYWPDLDVDLAAESIDHPERFPLVSRARPNKRMQPARANSRAHGVRRRARG